ncbi:MAG: hypothetical protein QOE05_1247 [Actinomycetota bacterium]|jgi:hypothetical protein|nr:hypothetical protein [Actinomycetota bacterium]
MNVRAWQRRALVGLAAVATMATALGAASISQHHRPAADRAAAPAAPPGDAETLPADRAGDQSPGGRPDGESVDVALRSSEAGGVTAIAYTHAGRPCMGFADRRDLGTMCEAPDGRWDEKATVLRGETNYGDGSGEPVALAWGFAPAGTAYVELDSSRDAPIRLSTSAISGKYGERAFFFGSYKITHVAVQVTAYDSQGHVIESHQFGTDTPEPSRPPSS